MVKSGFEDHQSDQLVDLLKSEPNELLKSELLEPIDKAILDYSIKLTSVPGSIKASDIDPLRNAGFDDQAIHDLCCIVGYFAFVNRLADGLGVELE